jgi:hypothetical protein
MQVATAVVKMILTQNQAVVARMRERKEEKAKAKEGQGEQKKGIACSLSCVAYLLLR